MDRVSRLVQAPDPWRERATREGRLEREACARPRELPQPLEHHPTGGHGNTFRIEGGQTSGDDVGVDELVDLERAPQQHRRDG